MHGQFVWYDLMTSDPAGAQRYYPQITGWKTQKFDKASPDNPYTMWTMDNQAIGGVAQLSPEQRTMGIPPHWLPSVQVNNVDETARQATSLGGKVVFGPSDIPGTGRYAVIQDPQGAAIAVFRPQEGDVQGFDGTNRAGRFSWHELMTTDHRAAFEFYRKLFGWEKTSDMEMGPGNIYQMYGMKGKQYGGMYNRPPEMGQVPPFWLPYVHVRDLKRATDVATSNGFKIVSGPMEVPGGDTIVVLKDPQGAAFAMHQAPTKAAKPAAAAASKPTAKAKTKSKAKPKAKVKARPKAKAKAKPKAKAKKKAKAKSRPRAKAKGKKKARRR
jgi:predicted enzyme related to lactoylglutathione lyase